MIKILFVCHGNICRSPMAEFIMKKMVCEAGLENDFSIASAAVTCEEIGNDIYPPAKRKLTEKKVPFQHRAARIITKEDFAGFDYIIGMDASNRSRLLRFCDAGQQKKISLLLEWAERKGQDVADPWYTGDFEEVYQDIVAGCSGLLKKLANTNSAG